METFDLEETAGQKGLKWLGRVLAVIIVLAVAAFGDVMYIKLMSDTFPAGLLLVVCYIGAFTSFLSTCYLLIGKNGLFTPGKQMVFAWIVFFAELVLIALNVILVFQSDGKGAAGFLAVWLFIAPATPVINMAGVAILWFLDSENEMRHEAIEMGWKIKRQQRRIALAAARAQLNLQEKQLGHLITHLERAANSPESLGMIQRTAVDYNNQLLAQLSGFNYGYQQQPAQLPNGNTVDGSAEKSIDTPAASELTSNRAFRQLPRQQRRHYAARLHRKSIDASEPTTEKVAVPPLAKATLAAEAQTSSTPETGSRGKKQVSRRGAIQGK